MSTATITEPSALDQADPGTDLVVIVPSRGRPDNAVELIKAFDETGTVSRAVFALDDDDPQLGRYQAVLERRPLVSIALSESPSNMGKALNSAAITFARADDSPFAIAFMGDDHRPRTRGWDQEYLTWLRSMRTGLVYGNDLLQKGHLPTQVAITTDIIRTLGYMAPPTLRHLYFDNFWLRLGKELGRLKYLPEVIVEHMHPGANKAEWDEGYTRVNAPEMWAHDKQAYRRYIATQFRSDVMKVRQLVRRGR